MNLYTKLVQIRDNMDKDKGGRKAPFLVQRTIDPNAMSQLFEARFNGLENREFVTYKPDLKCIKTSYFIDGLVL